MEPLCDTCLHGQVMHGPTASDRVVECSFFSNKMPKWPVLRCNEYQRRGTASLDDMKAIAWRLQTDKKTNTIGFAPPKKRYDDD